MEDHSPSCCHTPNKTSGFSWRSVDWLLWISSVAVLIGCLIGVGLLSDMALPSWLTDMSADILDLISKMWVGLIAAIFFVGLLGRVPRQLVTQALGKGGSFSGIARATLAGVMLDLCSHGILMVGTKLYERGASIGQVMAFLIASPWNSLSLTIIMISLIGLGWTLAFILLSALIAIVSGLIFDALATRGKLPDNRDSTDDSSDEYHPPLGAQLKQLLAPSNYSARGTIDLIWDGIKESRMVFRWLLFGVVLAAVIRTFVPLDIYQQLFGPSLAGLFLTIIAATIIEVCSEGSTPIAADLLTRAAAPGNAFSFLMAGVSTDYTEVMVLRDATRSWRIALFLPLITLPQVLILGFILNQFG